MNRKNFIKYSLTAGFLGLIPPSLLSGSKNKSERTAKQNENLVHNHLPNKEYKTMNTILHKAETRGHANHGWLDTHHTFSFANYYNPDRMNFGALRVLNDDKVAAGMGFGAHPHNNMEIISIPLKGDLEHKDSMGNVAVIRQGDVQVMSAGTGIRHSEYNRNDDKDTEFLQIWVMPNKNEVTPRYDQIAINDLEIENKFFQILSPSKEDQGVWIHQNAWFSLSNFTKETNLDYKVNSKDNGVYFFILEGSATVEGQELSKRDGFGLWDIDKINLTVKENSKILLMEVPMSV